MCENSSVNYENHAFLRGWNKLPFGSVETVQGKIMDALSVNSRTQFWRHLNGQTRHSKAECEAIEKIFSEAGVIDIWGME